MERRVKYVVSTIDIYIFFLFLKGGIIVARSSRLESGFQDSLIKDLEKRLDGCMVFKMNQVQGIPDLLILYKDRWASLECKKGSTSVRQPNQQYYVDLMNEMSFSRFISRENKKEVLDELCEAFGA